MNSYEPTFVSDDVKQALSTPTSAAPRSSAPTSSPFIDLEVESEFVRACLQRPGFAQRVLNRIPDEVLSNEIHVWIIRELRQLMAASRGKLQRVAPEVMRTLAHRIEDVNKRFIYTTTIEELYRRPAEYEAFAENQIREYASYQTLTAGIRESISRHRGNQDVRKTINTLEEALRKSRAVLSDAEVYDYAANWKERESERRSKIEYTAGNIVVKSGIKNLDDQVKFAAGTVTGFIAPFKRYKSIVLNHMGFAAVLQGYNVFHVTLENTVQMTADRYDARFSGIQYSKLQDQARTDEDRQQVEKVFERVNNWPQRLKIFSGPAQKTSVADIAAEIEHMEMSEGFSPEVIILDYGNIFAPSTDMSRKEDHEKQTQVVWDMQDLAKRSRSPKVVISAFQAKAEAAKTDRITSDQVGKSVGISQALDAAVAINQNKEEKHLGVITLSPLFLRYGPILHEEVTLDSDFTRMTIDRGSDALWAEALSWEGVEGFGYEV
jgi:hypothetical protein